MSDQNAPEHRSDHSQAGRHADCADEQQQPASDAVDQHEPDKHEGQVGGSDRYRLQIGG